MLDKYKFNAGDKFPAANASSIDPDNTKSQTSGYLLGGLGISDISVFKTLGAGANNGKIKIKIEDDTYDNIGVDLNENASAISQLIAYPTDNNTISFTAHSFTVPAGGFYITAFSFNVAPYGNPALTWTLRRGEDIAGEVLASGSTGQHNLSADQSVGTPIWLDPGYYTVLLSTSIQPYIRYGTGVVGARAYNGSWTTTQGALRVKGYTATPVTYALIASRLQTAIRALSGKAEAVVFENDRFIFKSETLGRSSKVYKLLPPSTGTDLSGNGATPYLDCAANATEVSGDGDEYFLPRLNQEGGIPTEVLISPKVPYFGDGADGDAVISVNTTLASDKYYRNLTIKDGVVLNPNGYRIFVKNVLTYEGTGKIARNGNNGNNGSNGSSNYVGGAGGAGGAALAAGTIAGAVKGGNGSNGGSSGGNLTTAEAGAAANPSMSNVAGKAGVSGGNGASGGAAGVATVEAATLAGINLTLDAENLGLILLRGATSAFTLSGSAGSGGSGGGNGVSTGGGGGGAGAGGNGGVIYIAARIIITVNGNVFVEAKGGNGGNGGNGWTSGTSGGGGGGSGGQGGLVILIYSKITGTGTINLAGGTAGNGGVGFNSPNGATGNVGNNGKFIKLKIN